jgi:hypothetical protein
VNLKRFENFYKILLKTRQSFVWWQIRVKSQLKASLSTWKCVTKYLTKVPAAPTKRGEDPILVAKSRVLQQEERDGRKKRAERAKQGRGIIERVKRRSLTMALREEKESVSQQLQNVQVSREENKQVHACYTQTCTSKTSSRTN